MGLFHAEFAEGQRDAEMLMDENAVSKIVLDLCIKIHRRLGAGLLESAYERILEIELRKAGLHVARQVAMPVIWDGVKVEDAFRADLVVNDIVLIELKSVATLAPVHFTQITTYLKVSGIRLGLLINFGQTTLKAGYHGIANGMP